MNLPERIPTNIHDESFAGVTYHIRGELVPELQVDLGPSSSDVRASRPALEGDGRRYRAEEAAGRGQAQDRRPGLLHHAHVRRRADRVLARLARPMHPAAPEPGRGAARPRAPVHRGDRQPRLHLRADQGRAEHAARRARASSWTSSAPPTGDALVWLHGHGNVFLVNLDAGEQIDVEAGAWLFKDPTVTLEAVTMGLKTGLFGGGGKLTWNRFTGPGRLAIQTLFISPLEGVESNVRGRRPGGIAGR